MASRLDTWVRRYARPTIDTPGALRKALARKRKSAARLDAIIGYAACHLSAADAILLDLLAEPKLDAHHLSAAAATLRRTPCGTITDTLRAGICAHPAADMTTLTIALWLSTDEVVRQLGAQLGTLTPAAIWRVRQLCRGCVYPGADQHRMVAETAAAWAAWAAGDTARMAFLTTAVFDLYDEGYSGVAILAAGEAVLAAPAP